MEGIKLSKAIDFFEDLEKREKDIYNALCTKELEGIKTFWCEFEKAWIMPEACLRRQQLLAKTFSFGNDNVKPDIKCAGCKMAKKIQSFFKKKVKFPKIEKPKPIKIHFKTESDIPKIKICKECRKELEFNTKNFPVRYGKPIGNYCRECQKLRSKRNWREKNAKNPDKIFIPTWNKKKIKELIEAMGIKKEELKYVKVRKQLQEATGLKYCSVVYHIENILKKQRS